MDRANLLPLYSTDLTSVVSFCCKGNNTFCGRFFNLFIAVCRYTYVCSFKETCKILQVLDDLRNFQMIEIKKLQYWEKIP